jgi:hypothetical protein
MGSPIARMPLPLFPPSRRRSSGAVVAAPGAQPEPLKPCGGAGASAVELIGSA